MAKRYIITLTAANRVGIVAAVTTALDELGANLVEASQTVVQKFFTLILAADFPEQRNPEVIVGHIRDITRPYALEVSLKDPEQETLQEALLSDWRRSYLSLAGTDQPGVLRMVSTVFAQHDIDINDLYAVGHEDGSFCIALSLTVPAAVNLDPVVSELEEKGRSLELTATLQHGHGTYHPHRVAAPTDS